MAALSFTVFGVSVAALKLPLLVVNLVIAFLLLRTLERDAGLTPVLAGVASLFFIAAPPGTAAMLVEASGVNIEPFLYTLLIWLTRAHPAWCGAIFAVGFMQREFTLYSLLSLALIAAITGNLFTREALRRAFAGLRAAAEVWLVVTLAKQYSSAADRARRSPTSALRPTTSSSCSPASASTGHRRRWRLAAAQRPHDGALRNTG